MKGWQSGRGGVESRSHQVHIQGLLSHGAQGVNDQGPNGDVGDETAVHYIDMDPVAAGLVNGLDLHVSYGCGDGTTGMSCTW